MAMDGKTLQPQIPVLNTLANFLENGLVANIHPALASTSSVRYIADLGRFGSEEDVDILARCVCSSQYHLVA